MSNLHKIFFVGVVILSVAAGSSFSSVRSADMDRGASIIVSASDAISAKDAGQPEAAKAVSPNDSTTSNEIKVSGQSDISPSQQTETQATAMDNSALLKADSSASRSAFQRVGSDVPPEMQAKSALVADLKTGQSYFELDPTLRWPMASITKLMTAVMVMKNMDLNAKMAVSDAGIPADSEAIASAAFFKSGDAYSGSDTLAAMLLISKNEAAEAFSAAYGRAEFVAGLNSLAKEFGMNATYFSDPTGLSVSNQSTALDLEKLALNIYRDYQKIFEITRKKSGAVTELNSKKKTALPNINSFAGTSGFIGGKTGYTEDASGNLLSIFSYNNRPVVIIVLGTDDRFGETAKLKNWFESNYK